MSAVQVNPKDPLRTKGAQKIGMAVWLRDDPPPLLDVSDAPSQGNWSVKQIDAPLPGDSRHLDKSTGDGSEPMAGTTGEKNPAGRSQRHFVPARRRFRLLERRFEVRVLADFAVADAVGQVPDRGDSRLDADPPPHLDALDVVE
jgi:hypothetical protein